MVTVRPPAPRSPCSPRIALRGRLEGVRGRAARAGRPRGAVLGKGAAVPTIGK